MQTRELREMMDADAKMDINALADESLKTPTLHCKYYSILIDESKTLKGAEQELARLVKYKSEYYLGKLPDDVYMEKPLDLKVLKVDLEIYLAADDELQALQRKIKIQQDKVKMLDAYIREVINVRGFQIKNTIDFLKYKEGLNS